MLYLKTSKLNKRRGNLFEEIFYFTLTNPETVIFNASRYYICREKVICVLNLQLGNFNFSFPNPLSGLKALITPGSSIYWANKQNKMRSVARFT